MCFIRTGRDLRVRLHTGQMNNTGDSDKAAMQTTSPIVDAQRWAIGDPMVRSTRAQALNQMR